ncbi:MAG: EscU/YscU/HrcU family type III secretion system export apparatus switch protein [Lachnospiraceae bacterium]
MENKENKEYKEKQAIALTYQPGTEAPTIVAAGKGYLAEKIIKTAKENDVPLYADDKLADTLSRLQIGDSIPPELYKVVADILVFVDNMDKIKGKIKGKL